MYSKKRYLHDRFDWVKILRLNTFNPDYALGIVARRKRAKKTRAFEGLFGDAIVTLW